MGYSLCGWSGNQVEFYVDPGPNQENDIKLCLMNARKLYSGQYILSIKKSRKWDFKTRSCVTETRIVGVPTEAYLALLNAEQKAWESQQQEDDSYDTHSWKRRPSRKKKPRKAPGRGKPILSEEDLLEEKLSKPRCRHQRGWKEWYRPTAKTWRRRNDFRSWKTNSKARKSWGK